MHSEHRLTVRPNISQQSCRTGEQTTRWIWYNDWREIYR